MGSRELLAEILVKFKDRESPPFEFLNFTGWEGQPAAWQQAAWNLAVQTGRMPRAVDVDKALEGTGVHSKSTNTVKIILDADALDRLIGGDREMEMILQDDAVIQVLEKHLEKIKVSIEQYVKNAKLAALKEIRREMKTIVAKIIEEESSK